MKMRKRPTMAEYLNHVTFKVLYDHYRTICLNTFVWSGLPEGIEEKYIEKALFDEGKCLFFRDPYMSYMALPAYQGSQLDVYGEPLRWRAMGLNYNKEFDRDKCVLIENNKMRTATHDTLMYFVRKIYEAERTIDVNLQTAKTPWVIICDEKKVLTYKTIIQRVSDNEPAIFGANGLSLDSMQVLNTKSEFIGNELLDYCNGVESKLLTFLGINNVPIDKKERLITDEAQSNDQLIGINADLMLEARKRACEQINALYGLNVSVDLRHKPQEVENDVPADGDKGNDNAGGND